MSEIIKRIEHNFPDQFEQGQELLGSNNEFGPSIEFLENLCQDNETLKSLLDDMLDSCYRYTQDVFKMEQMVALGINDSADAEEFSQIDKERTILHNTTIDNVNILSRALAKAGKDNSWVEPIYRGGRSAYSRFALATTFNQYLRLRQSDQGGGQ